jgi:hypothetical protein
VARSEFGKTLRVSRREGNTLSAVVRQAWDHGVLRTLTKNSPTTATDTHVSIIGRITPRELRKELTTTDMASGFINRFLLLLARRSRYLPNGGQVDVRVREVLVRRFQRAADTARRGGNLRRDGDADAYWTAIYPRVTRERAGLVGDICTRAPAHILRVSMLYALAAESMVITLDHLKAALALWEYAEASALTIFGERAGDKLSDFFLSALRAQPAGLTRTELSAKLGRNRKAEDINAALELLKDYGLADRVKERTDGRPVERWFAIEFDTK